MSGFEARELTVRTAEATLRRVDLYVTGGELVGLLGDAGGSALLRTVAGVVAPANGVVVLDGEELSRLSAADVAARGVVLLAARRAPYAALTVREHLRAGAAGAGCFVGSSAPPSAGASSGAGGSAGAAERAERVLGWFPGLVPYLDARAGALDRAVADLTVLAAAVASAPRVLLVDGLLPLAGATAYAGVLDGLRAACAADGTAVVVADVLAPDSDEIDPDAFDRAFLSRNGLLRPWHAAARAGGTR
jgi:branched-chain amino acid transport system ATP-binding protein